MGIDYGLGETNIDKDTGIRYGVISQHDVGEAWFDESEAWYGYPHCPECWNALENEPSDNYECGCGYVIQWVGEECYPDEPLSYRINNGEYVAECNDSGDIFVFKSPYYTKCDFCSPCAPGASDLTSEGDVKAYCFGPDWFDGEPPHEIYLVSKENNDGNS